MSQKELEAFRSNHEALMRFSARYRADEALRARIENGDYGDLYGEEVPTGVEVRIVCQTPEVFYMPMPENPNAAVSDQELGAVAGGRATFGSVMSAGSQIGTFSSQSSIGTTVVAEIVL